MLKHEAVKLSPLGYAKRDSERGTLYATNGGLYLELGGALRPITLPPDRVDTWQPVMPEPEPVQPHGSTWEPVMPDVQQEPRSEQLAGPERWADQPTLRPDQVVLHREKRRPATVS